MPDAVSDSGPLIHLDEIQQLSLLALVFTKIHIPEQVLREISNVTVHAFIQQHTEIILIEQVPEQSLFSVKDTFPGFRLHLADFAVISILCKNENATAITDDLELRKAIESSGRAAVGTVGILFRAYKQGGLAKDQLRNFIGLLFNDSSLYLSSAFRNRVLAMIESSAP